ncbi:MAG: FAD-binding protein, partial [Chloroflexi bacterium]|nr:FAD-binding protein [Chloroflexota bacterium]
MAVYPIDRIIETDVLVIGGGGAACRAAVAAHDAGARVLLALKGKLGASGATTAPGRGVAWQVADECSSPEDSPEVHLANILDAGLGMANPTLARILAYELPERTAEMERWGLRFIPDPEGRKRHYSAYSCFGDQPRAHGILNSGHGHAGDIVVVLQKQMALREILVHENIFVVDLIVHKGACCGAVALGTDGTTILYRAGAVVLGAGGARQIFPSEGRHLIDTTGDGYAMALRAGAALTNMEFAQYMLRIDPQGQTLDVPGFIWALYPTVRNNLGEDILPRYLPAGVTPHQAMWERTLHHPFSCRDASGWLDIAIASEVLAGRGSP